jgi:hypothetical protein
MAWLDLLKKAVTEAGNQAAVARELGYSPAVISQALQGIYPGDTEKLAAKVIEVYGNETVECPLLGVITLAKCVKNQQLPFSSANPLAVEIWATCPLCKNNKKRCKL